MTEPEKVWAVLKRAADWTFRIRNNDNGWSALEGEVLPLWEGHMGSNPTDTAEITLPMLELGLDRGEAPKATQQVREAIDHKSTFITRAPRQLMWPYMLLGKAGDTSDIPRMKFELKVLKEFKEKKAGWSLVRGKRSNVYDSSITLKAIARTRTNFDIEGSISWLKSIQNSDGGWGVYSGDKSNPACTAHATVSLIECGESTRSDLMKKAVDYIREKQRSDGGWDTEMEKVPFISIHGYTHFSAPWCIMALMLVNWERDKEFVSKGIQFLLNMQDQEGGWRANQGGPRLVFATGNTMSTLGMYYHNIKNSL